MLTLATACSATALSPRAQLLRLVPRSGFAAPAQATEIDAAARALEESAEAPGFPRDLMEIEGRWRLLYTSSPALALPAGLPPPFDLASSPLAPRAVEQRIDVMGRRVVNCVTINPWPVGDDVPGGALLESLPILGGPIAALAKASVRLELDHKFDVEGDGADGGPRRAAGTNRIAIALERVERTLSGLDESASPLFATLLPTESRLEVPEPVKAFNAALASTALGGGLFDTTYCDESIRISRGTSPIARELRVFVKADATVDGDTVVPEPFEDRFASAPPGEDDADPADSIPSD